MTDIEEKFLPVKPLRANLTKACFDLAAELSPMLRHWPKVQRQCLGRRLENQVFDLLEHSVMVTNPTLPSARKRECLGEMSSETDKTLVLLRLAKHEQCLGEDRYLRLSRQVIDIGRQVGGLGKFLRHDDNSVRTDL